MPRRFEFWDWPPPRARSRPWLTPDAPKQAHRKAAGALFSGGRYSGAPPRRTSWFDTPIGYKIGHAVFRIGVTVWMTAALIALTAMMLGALWLLIALAKAI
jgi:hypothetical protein